MAEPKDTSGLTAASQEAVKYTLRLEAENERLREALSYIKNLKPEPVAEGLITGPQALLNAAQREAREALNEQPERKG